MSSKLKWTYQPFDNADKNAPSIAPGCLELHKRGSLVADQATQAVPPQQWPKEAESLAADPRYDIVMNIYDTFLCAIPLLLIAKTSSCIYAHQLDKDHTGYTIDRVGPLTIFLLSFNDQLVTAFTIVFVTIMSTLVRRLALYRAQEGATVSDLEQLQASISLPSTIKTVFSLRKFTKFSLALVAVWSFYYLGSQASKREYGYVPSDPYHHITAVYPTNNVGYIVDILSNAPGIEYVDQQLRASFEHVRSKNAITGVDRNGHVLVPNIDPSTHSTAIQDSQWIKFQPSQVTFSALAGRALSIEPRVAGDIWEDEKIMGDYSFNTTYMDVQCGSVEIHPESAFPANVTPGMWTSINKTSLASSSLPLVGIDVWGRWNESYGKINDTYPVSPPVEINDLPSGSIKVTCNVTNRAVKLQVHCSELACLAKAIKYLSLNATEQFVHPLADDDFATAFFSSLLLSYGPPTGIYRMLYGTAIEDLIGPKQLILDISSGKPDIADLIQTLSSYLTRFTNTYYNLLLVNEPFLTRNYDPGPESGYNFVSVNGSLYDPHYALSWAWITVSYVSGSILFVAAIFSFWLRRRTLAPDIFGYVSSLTRENPHLMVPDGGSTMSGIDRARHLQDMKIRICDVNGRHGDIGRVGVTIVQDSEGFSPLCKERKYL